MDSLIDSFHGEADVSEYFSRLSHDDRHEILACELLDEARPIVSKKLLHSIKKPMESMFSAHDLEFCDMYSVAFVAIISYAKKTYSDVLRVLNKGIDIKSIPKLYVHNGKPSIGMVCKLFGLRKCGNMKKMDCPRVWDLVEDEVVNNPNIYGNLSHPIAAITHRWGPNEVTYKDLVRLEQINVVLKELGGKPKSMRISPMSPKLAKIREELIDNVRYVWMDTLCIDKTSSVELDMSIRSMYRWYSSASFVYLEYYTNFGEWCTRGWTLQEGYAAESLHVSPVHGNSFMELVSNLDNNSAYKLALSRTPERSLSAYWTCLMNARETTVIEDKAYALVGVLGISFQFAYGEGEISSSRLAEEMAKQKGDVSWLISNFIGSEDICGKEVYTQWDNVILVNNQGITLPLDLCDEHGIQSLMGYGVFLKASDKRIVSMGLEHEKVLPKGSYGNLYVYPPYVFDGPLKYKIRTLADMMVV